MTRLRASLSLFVYLSVAYGQQQPSDLIWQLGDVDRYRPTRNPSHGYQNFTWCCVKAVAEALEVESGLLKLRPGYDDWIVIDSGNISDLVRYTDSSLFPCTATYVKGNNNVTPIVRVPYEWFVDVCPGWQLNDNTNLNAWLQPLSGFILPAVIFCLSVPRRRKLGVPRALFSPELSRTSSYLVVLPGAILAGIMVSIDTIIWLCTCFAFAGPMILSGLYEALLDNRMLDFVKERIRNKNLTLDMRCRLLMVVLIGNLDLALDVSQNRDTVQSGGIQSPSQSRAHRLASAEPTAPSASSNNDESAEQSTTAIELEDQRPTTRERSGLRTSQLSANRTVQESSANVVRRQTDHLQASPWRHMERLLYDIRLYEADNPAQELSPRQIACHNANHRTVPRLRTAKIEKQIRKTKTRLRTMLHCQYSFGSIVGAPVIFFLGGFVFALLQSLTIIGDESVALGLAFGQWYMTIPHIAIVSGLLLAGNNPNILEGVLATVRGDPQDRAPGFFGLRFELAYPSCYKVAWQWLRGPTKRRWIEQVINTYRCFKDPRCIEDLECEGDAIDGDIDELQKRTILSLLDWSLVLTLTLLLLGVPLILAFLTAFYTPEVGISCRALTITIYGSVQFGQILLWLWAYAGPPAKVEDGTAITNFFREGGWLDVHDFYTPTSNPLNSEDRVRPRTSWVQSLWCVIWYASAIILLITSVGAAVGGTLMQLVGVYTANICKITTGSWFAPLSQRPIVLISVNSPDRINNALQYWVPCAVTAIIFMIVVGFMAWWYQRRMRDMFTEIVRTVDDKTWDRSDTEKSRQESSSAN